jgi:hypothetical protein
MSRSPFSKDAQRRWLFIAAVGAMALTGLSRLALLIDPSIFVAPLVFGVFIYALGLSLYWLGTKTGSFVFAATSDFFCSAGQLMTLFVAACGLQYVAAAANFPLMDDVFAKADRVIGFEWHAYRDLLAQSRLLEIAFIYAYSSVYLQIVILALLHCMTPKSDGNAEFIWCLGIGLIAVIAISAFMPALGYPGEIGQQHIDVLQTARNGMLKDLAGIITFPSFHTVLGVLLIYYSRTLKFLLPVTVPLNVMLILATPPVGGHYLIDVLAGLVVAAATIKIVPLIRPSQNGGSVSLWRTSPSHNAAG